MNGPHDERAADDETGAEEPEPPTWVEHLRRHGWTVATAESMTAGLLAARLAGEPDSGEVFAGGVVTYQTRLKEALLGIGDVAVISEDCAAAMAEGCAQVCGTDVAVAITGVAGPERQEGAPVGLVYGAVHTPERTTTHEWRFDGEPDEVREATVVAAVAALTAAVADGDRGGTA